MWGLPSNLAIAATVTSALALLVIGLPLRAAAPADERRRLLRLFLLMLPMNALAFHGVRVPLSGWVSSLLADWPGPLAWIQVAYAPLTEEPAKLWPFLLLRFSRPHTRARVVRDALAIGLGFGIGEAWNVAWLLKDNPGVGGQPWFALGGFIGERMMVCVMHAAFTATALYLWAMRAAPVRGFLAAFLLHFAGNAPLMLAARGAFGIDRATWGALLSVWVLLFFLAMGALLSWILFGAGWAERLIHGTMRCPGCGGIYRRPIFRVNMVTRSFERCPLCRRWHWVSPFDSSDQGPA